VIVRTKRGFAVMDHTGKRVLGVHDSREKAVRQLRAIEIHKHSRETKGK
jgi:hypothetical protein